MKKGIHPKYDQVAFKDISTGAVLLTRSTAETRETISIDGKKIALFSVEVSSNSHPFYTGAQKIVDTGGRVDRFKKITEKTAAVKKSRKKVKTREEKLAHKRAKATKPSKQVVSKKKVRQASTVDKK